MDVILSLIFAILSLITGDWHWGIVAGIFSIAGSIVYISRKAEFTIYTVDKPYILTKNEADGRNR